MGRLASHLEGDIVGGVALELKGRGRAVVEVLVDKLEIEKTRLSVNLDSSSRIAKLLLPRLRRDAGASRGFPSGRRGFFPPFLLGWEGSSRRWPAWRYRRSWGSTS